MSNPNNDAMQKMFMEWTRCAQPGPEHKLLEKMAGKWTTVTRAWMDPSAPPGETSGQSEGKMMFGGRFLVANLQGICMGQQADTMTVIGFDIFKRQYQSVALGTTGTTIYFMSGTAEPDGRTITFRGEMDDPMGKRPVRFVLRIDSEDRHALDVYDSMMGKEVRLVETVHTRVK